METGCLEHRLSVAEREAFERDGYLIVADVLDSSHTRELAEVLMARFGEAVSDGAPGGEYWVDRDILSAGDAFVDLLDHPGVLPKIWGILGWNIFLYHVRGTVVPPSGREREDKTLGWHQDSGRINFDIDTRPRPRLSVKVAWFLSDATEDGCGNFWILPGSHVLDVLKMPEDGVSQPAGALQIRVPAGSVVFFDRRMWHAASPNWSERPRLVLFYGYGYRWMRQRDDHTALALLEGCDDPVRRQLLGDVASNGGFYVPNDDDVPLREWLKLHSPSEVGA